jgi:hypothetical protein
LFDDDSTRAKPTHCSTQNRDGGVGGFIVVDLGVGHPGVVVDNGMDEGMAQ